MVLAVNATAIPEQLCRAEFRFILLNPCSKIPIEEGWPTTANYPYDNLKLWDHRERNGNYGVVGGAGNLIVIDADCKELRTTVKTKFPPTFTVETSSSDRAHFYYQSDVEGEIIRFSGGQITGRGGFVVGPGSIHPKTNKPYLIVNDKPIAFVPFEEIKALLCEFLPEPDGPKQAAEDEWNEAKSTRTVGLDGLWMENIVDISKFSKVKDGYQGPHPIHGSTNGHNLHINIILNVWHCFRCGSGGGPLHWIAVQEGIIGCSDAKAGVLRGDKFERTLKIAEAKYGLRTGRSVLADAERSRGSLALETVEGTAPPRYIKYKNGRAVFDASALAEDIKKDFVIKTAKDNREMFVYQDGIYVTGAENIIRRECKVRAGEEITVHQVNEVLYHTEASTYIAREALEPPPNLIHLANGIYNLEGHTFGPHSPNIPALSKLPIVYDEEADCPTIKKFLGEVLNPEDMPVVQEMFGYCLYRQYIFHKAFMMCGGGRNGKTTLIQLIIEFLGKENVSNVPLQTLDEDKFARGTLYRKAANLFADLKAHALKDTGSFKSLCGGDRLYADAKFKAPFSFENYAKLIFSCNQPPRFHDDTVAIWERWVFLSFPNTFIGDNADEHLLEKLTTPQELSGLFNWAVQGLERLMTNHGFSYSKTSEDTRTLYIQLSDPLAAFVDTLCEKNAKVAVSKAEFYSAYVIYCDVKGLHKLSENAVGRRLKTLAPNVVGKKETINEVRVPRWVGLRLLTWDEVAGDDGRDVQDVHVFFYFNRVARERNDKIGKNPDNSANPDGGVQSTLLASLEGGGIIENNPDNPARPDSGHQPSPLDPVQLVHPSAPPSPPVGVSANPPPPLAQQPPITEPVVTSGAPPPLIETPTDYSGCSATGEAIRAPVSAIAGDPDPPPPPPAKSPTIEPEANSSPGNGPRVVIDTAAGCPSAPAASPEGAVSAQEAPGEGALAESAKSAAGRTCRTCGMTTTSEIVLTGSSCPYCGAVWPVEDGAAEDSEEGDE